MWVIGNENIYCIAKNIYGSALWITGVTELGRRCFSEQFAFIFQMHGKDDVLFYFLAVFFNTKNFLTFFILRYTFIYN